MWQPYDPLSYVAHLVFGFLAFAGAITALSTRKGSPLHRRGGWIFVVSMSIAALTAVVFEVEFDESRPLVLIMAAATLYLVASGVAALRHERAFAPVLEKVLVIVPTALFAMSAMTMIRSALAGVWTQVLGPALYAGVFTLLTIGDLRVIARRPVEHGRWLKRHLFRMLLAFAFAVRALFSIGIETGLPFEFVVTAPIVIALGATLFFFRRVNAGL